MTVQDKLPPEFERIAGLVDQQPPARREVFHFMLAVTRDGSGKAKLLSTAQVEKRTWYSQETAAVDAYSVVRLEIELEKAMG